MLLVTQQKWQFSSIMNRPTHFFYRYFKLLGGLIQPMLEVTGYLKLD